MAKIVVPNSLKALNSYIKTASEFEKRDPVISYYCRLYAVQKGMEIDRTSNESKKFLMEMMDILDKSKVDLKDNENIESETVGQAYVEQYALRLFSYADNKDRNADFGQATIRSFITAGFLMDVLAVFGEVPEDVEKCRKYAKWKAVYINQCLKNGEAPHPGPLEDSNEIANANDMFPSHPTGNPSSSNPPTIPTNTKQSPSNVKPTPPVAHQPAPHAAHQPAPTAAHQPAPSNTYYDYNNATTSQGNNPATTLTAEEFLQAEKYCKYAISSLQYQDSATAIKYLTQSLDLLTKKKH